MLDKQASPLKYQTSEKTILLGYNHTGSKGIFGAQINGALGDFFPTGFKGRQMYDPGYNDDGTPKKDSSYIPGTLYSGRIKISYLRQATSGYNVIGKGQLYSHNYYGASLNNQLFYSDNIVRTGWLNSASFNGEYMHTAMLNTNHFFSIKISIPLFAENTRLPYHNTISSPTGESNVKTFFREGSRFAWFGNLQNIQIDAAYEYNISNHWSMGVRYFGNSSSGPSGNTYLQGNRLYRSILGSIKKRQKSTLRPTSTSSLAGIKPMPLKPGWANNGKG